MSELPVKTPFLDDFTAYLAQLSVKKGASVPSMKSMSQNLGISISTIREKLMIARALGFVEVKPRTGIKFLPYSFTPAVLQSLAYAVSLDRSTFRQFSDLRNHIEASYWYQAVSSLHKEDIQELRTIIIEANEKLNSDPIRIPHAEHRQLHLVIYRRLENEFVRGILEAYWDIYEAVGLSVYEDRKYLERVWAYHQQMVDAIVNGDFLTGYQNLIAHMDLLFQRDQTKSKIPFE
jgi:DNA-binding FadR family transcriptional regulator